MSLREPVVVENLNQSISVEVEIVSLIHVFRAAGTALEQPPGASAAATPAGTPRAAATSATTMRIPAAMFKARRTRSCRISSPTIVSSGVVGQSRFAVKHDGHADVTVR